MIRPNHSGPDIVHRSNLTPIVKLRITNWSRTVQMLVLKIIDPSTIVESKMGLILFDKSILDYIWNSLGAIPFLRAFLTILSWLM